MVLLVSLGCDEKELVRKKMLDGDFLRTQIPRYYNGKGNRK